MNNPLGTVFPLPGEPPTDHLIPAPIRPLSGTNHVHNSNTASLPVGHGGYNHGGGGGAADPYNGGINGQFGANTGRMQPNSVINLSNSSDVVIGPMTQYQGAVTIYQYMDATVDSATGARGALRMGGIKASEDVNQNTTSKSIFARTPRRVWIVALIFIFGFGILGLIGLYMTLQKVQSLTIKAEDERGPPEIRFSNGYSSNTIPDLGNDHIIIDRKQWGAKSVKGPNLRHPIRQVIITHVGVQDEPCESLYSCSVKMRTLQDSAIAEKDLIDVPANFYVSKDGYIYVGRGWSIQNSYSTNSLAVCFLGDYLRFEPSAMQLEGASYLLEYGLTKNFLDKDYLLMAHNQTTKTASPGSNVYKKIIKWPHWNSSCGVSGEPLCDLNTEY